ncbi:MAG: stage V sporulation protein AA [Lachnospiraceae bacterium]|nr:stage V sporulation protein AA [Lachnospiraceae bacterium]
MPVSDILYMKIDRNIELNKREIYLSDVAKLECVNKEILNRVKAIKLMNIPDEKNNRFVFSVLKVIELIHKLYPNLEINNMGEIDFIIDYEKPRKQPRVLSVLKLLSVCVITFFGAAFAIMTFNNDVGVDEVFGQVHELVLGEPSDGFTVLELTYSIGLTLGILVFYNHFGGKKITSDPTPVEVEMRLYEDDINTTLIEGVNRRDKHIEVN